MYNKRKIALVSNTLCVGGVERMLLELSKNISYENYEVTLFLRNADGELFSEIDKRVKIQYWGMCAPSNSLGSLLRRGLFKSFIQGASNRFLARVYSNDWARNDFYATKSIQPAFDTAYDCVIAYHGVTPGVISSSLFQINARKKLLWIHGKDAFTPQNVKFFEKAYAKFDRVFCVSKDTECFFVKRYSKLLGKTAVAYNLVDDQKIQTDATAVPEYSMHPISIVTVGRLTAVKGQQMVPRVARLLLDAGYDVHWYMIGDGPMREEIEREIEENGVAGRVVLLGTQLNPYPYIKNCDIYVQPSFSEGYCTTTVEAKILQKPIVTTDAPGMREQFVSGENGLIVEGMTPEALFEGVKTLLDHPEICRKFTDNLKRESFDNAAELQKLYDFIEN